MSSFKRTLWLIAGITSVALGLLGAVLPLLPTTPFMLLAAFCFARGSKRLHAWLLNHPQFGQPIQDWNEKGAIALRVKFLAIMSMLFVLVLSFMLGVPIHVVIIQVVVLSCVAVFLLTRPNS